MQKYWWIVFIALGLWQVGQSLLEQMAKKQQEERLREAARQRGAATERARRTGSVGPEGAPPTIGPAQERQQALAARRQAQLEQLRKRRQAGASPQVRAGGTIVPAPTTAVPVPTPPRAIQEMDARRTERDVQERRQVQAKRQAREQRVDDQKKRFADQRRRAHALEAQHQESRREQARETEKAARTLSSRVAPADAVENPYALLGVQTGRRERLRLLLGDRASLRELFLLKELLDPPVSLRSEAKMMAPEA